MSTRDCIGIGSTLISVGVVGAFALSARSRTAGDTGHDPGAQGVIGTSRGSKMRSAILAVSPKKHLGLMGSVPPHRPIDRFPPPYPTHTPPNHDPFPPHPQTTQ